MIMSKKPMHTLVIGDDEFDLIDDELRERVDSVEESIDGILEIADPSQEYVNLSVGDDLSATMIRLTVSGEAETLFPDYALGVKNTIATFSSGWEIYEECEYNSHESENQITIYLEKGAMGDMLALIPAEGTMDIDQDQSELPLNIGKVASINKNAMSYPYLFRKKNAKLYAINEDKERFEITDFVTEGCSTDCIESYSGFLGTPTCQIIKVGKLALLNVTGTPASSSTPAIITLKDEFMPKDQGDITTWYLNSVCVSGTGINTATRIMVGGEYIGRIFMVGDGSNGYRATGYYPLA